MTQIGILMPAEQKGKLYILNSAVLTAFGTWVYKPLSVADANYWIDWANKNGVLVSAIGYEETAEALSQLLKTPIPVNRITVKMEPGDKAIVFRLVLPPGSPRIDPKDKGQILGHLEAGHWELGLLEFLAPWEFTPPTSSPAYPVWEAEEEKVKEGGKVEKFTLANGTAIPAILVGESGRGRELGVLPVRLLSQQEWEKEGKTIVRAGRISTTRSGRPKLEEAERVEDWDKVVLVLRAHIGFRGTNIISLLGGGNLPTLVEGRIAQGEAGRMGSGSQMVLLLSKGQVVKLEVSGRLYGAPSEYYYTWDGSQIKVATDKERELGVVDWL